MLARKIKAEIEAMLPATPGRLTRIGQGFRARVEALDPRPAGRSGRGSTSTTGRGRSRRARRRRATVLERLLDEGEAAAGVVHLVGTGPGDRS